MTERRGRVGRAWRALTWFGSLGSIALAAHSMVNLRRMRTPDIEPAQVTERVSVLLPLRDEAHQIAECLVRVLDQIRVPDLEILVVDDGSADGTADAVRAAAAGDPRVRVLTGAPLPEGWLGKPHACAQLAREATGSVLVFVDADVRLAPQAVAAAVSLLRGSGLDLVSPYPRQVAESAGERLVQPLLQWSWLTLVPLRVAERSPRPSLAVANGQFLVVDAAAYRRAGGHAGVRDQVLDDVALLRAVKRAGGTGVVIDGTQVAVCRMYRDWESLSAGYGKSLWAAFGSPAGAAAVGTGLAVLYVVPPLAGLTGSPIGLAGYGAAVASRYLAAERTGGRSLPDAFFHPASVLTVLWLLAASWRDRRAGRLAWKGRQL
ncbi:MAG TPA: glycosyltransferase family 2 protein [Kineosporiaceae bacterium]